MIISARYEITCETEEEKENFHAQANVRVDEPGEGWTVTHDHVSADPCKHTLTMEYQSP